MLEKLLETFGELSRETTLVAFLLKNSSCPMQPPIIIPKTESNASVSFVYSDNFQNCWESICVWNHFLVK